MPGRVFRTNFAVPMSAPVLPALTHACARPALTRSMAMRIEECFLVRMAVRTSSSIETTSVAATTARRSSSAARWRLSSAASASGRPTRSNVASTSEARKSRLAGTVTPGPWSPPMASTAMTVFIADEKPGLAQFFARSLLRLDDLLAAVVAGRRDVVAQVRLTGGRLYAGWWGREEVVRPMHAALRRRLLVLLNGHGVSPIGTSSSSRASRTATRYPGPALSSRPPPLPILACAGVPVFAAPSAAPGSPRLRPAREPRFARPRPENLPYRFPPRSAEDSTRRPPAPTDRRWKPGGETCPMWPGT